MLRFRQFTRFTCVGLAASLLAACGGGGGGTGGSVTPPSGGSSSIEGCNAILSASSARAPGSGTASIALRPPQRSTVAYVPGKLEVVLRSAAAHVSPSAVREFSSDASIDREFTYTSLNRSTAIVRTLPGNEDRLAQSLRTLPGVERVERLAYRSRASSVPLPVNDAYWRVVNTAITGTSGTYNTYVGQWNMHVVRADYAWGYSTLGFSSLGAGMNIAIIDTGADLSHPDLVGKRVVRTQCFVTGAVNSSGTDVSDLDGHGTNVTGIAAASTNNSIAFASTGYDANLMIYKVFPNPPAAGCSPGSTDPACGADPTDVASAINDAVANGARVINLSLGSPTPDATEENAVAAAIAAGVVVVAASGNGDSSGNGVGSLDFPAADPGVIAVGASALNDTASQASPTEYVAHYSNYSSSNPSWGIVAPGGDPVPCETASSNPCNADYEHWIEQMTSSEAHPAANCNADRGGTAECRFLIAGTSQATPHVTGAVALLLGAGVSAASVKSLLCTYADPISGTALSPYATLPAAASGCGRLDIYRAMAHALGDTDPGPGGDLNS